MGRGAACWLGDLFLGGTRDEINPPLMTLFRDADKRVVADPSAAMPAQVAGWVDDLEEYQGAIVYYVAPANVIRDRLNHLGYTMQTTREAFTESVRRECALLEEQIETFAKKAEGEETPEQGRAGWGQVSDHLRRTQKLLSGMTVEAWCSALHDIQRQGLGATASYPARNRDDRTLVGYMLANDWYGCPGVDRNIVVRLALEAHPDATEVIYDVTDLVLGEETPADYDFVAQAHAEMAYAQSTAKTILLTEGRSDAEILKRSLTLLYPHLADYYSFMEFELARVAGGAGSLVNVVKAFAGAGIVNRTIALFDNDTAAATALKALAGC